MGRERRKKSGPIRNVYGKGWEGIVKGWNMDVKASA